MIHDNELFLGRRNEIHAAVAVEEESTIANRWTSCFWNSVKGVVLRLSSVSNY